MTARRQFIEDGCIEVAVNGHRQGARDGGGRHHQQVGVVSFVFEFLALFDPKAMLFVDDGDAQAVILHRFGNQGVGAHNQIDLAVGDAFEHASALFGTEATGQERHPHAVALLGIHAEQLLDFGQTTALGIVDATLPLA